MRTALAQIVALRVDQTVLGINQPCAIELHCRSVPSLSIRNWKVFPMSRQRPGLFFVSQLSKQESCSCLVLDQDQFPPINTVPACLNYLLFSWNCRRKSRNPGGRHRHRHSRRGPLPNCVSVYLHSSLSGHCNMEPPIFSTPSNSTCHDFWGQDIRTGMSIPQFLDLHSIQFARCTPPCTHALLPHLPHD